MKKLLAQFVILILLTSCGSTYFYSTLNTYSDKTWKDDDGYFITELDSIDIIHSFKGENAPIMITILNRSKQPLYVDWAKSAVIIDGIASSYSGSISTITVSAAGNTDFLLSNNYSNSTFDPTLSLPENITFIPPFSRINYQTLSLTNFGFEDINNKEYQNKKMGDKDGYPSNVKVLNFTLSDSPLKFRSYLTLYGVSTPPIIVDEEFYLCNLIKTKGISPSSMHSSLFDRGDMFYVRIAPNNQFGEILLGSALLMGVVVLDGALGSSSLNNNCCY